MTEESMSSRQLPEDRQFRAVLIGSCIAAALFIATFGTITFVAAVSDSGLLTSEWYAAWGTWAGGAATAAAFIIAAFSLRVSSAHAHADRAEAARIRADADMAQARLLIISKVFEPGVPQALASFKIENRSRDVFFDVKVPYVDCPTNTDGGVERRTPDMVERDNRLHEYLPDEQLLVPFRSHTEDEAWFTLVTVHTVDWQQVKFAVEYTDAAGQRWKQHLGGQIERVLTTDAVPVREADRFHPGRQIRILTPEEGRERGGKFARGLPEDREAELAEMRAIGPALVATWRGVSRVGVPRASPVKDAPGRIRLAVDYAPSAPTSWEEHFNAQIRAAFNSFGVQRGGGSDVVRLRVEVAEDDLEDAVSKIDQAIQYANDEFERNEMTEIRALLARDAADAKAASDHQAQLDKRIAMLARPDPPGGSQRRRRPRSPQHSGDGVSGPESDTSPSP